MERADTMTTWWTSDTHFSHENIIKYCNRPFRDVQEMNEALIEKWNSTVSPDDVVYHLGDLALGQAIEQQIALTARLEGHKHLVPGNHDRIAESFEGRRNDAKFLPLYEDAGWSILPEKFEHSIGERRVVVCHFPYVGDSLDEDRYRLYRPRNSGLPIIHGHVHNLFATLGRQFNVGVDVRGFAPVDEAVIVRWLESLEGMGDLAP
ncbi:metallophosphoesterase [Mycetocola sp. 2940]|uniref:metallophosphoesterase n=1 Tax=Mycetocola sp. 2940 TaxID=3156452 RepID=UPI003390A0A2